MARGWESKAVADQMEQNSNLSPNTAASDSSETTPARSEELESLRLSRARTLDQLTRATNPHHRLMLERALHALEAKIKDMQ